MSLLETQPRPISGAAGRVLTAGLPGGDWTGGRPPGRAGSRRAAPRVASNTPPARHQAAPPVMTGLEVATQEKLRENALFPFDRGVSEIRPRMARS
jgi:hypothetical protein